MDTWNVEEDEPEEEHVDPSVTETGTVTPVSCSIGPSTVLIDLLTLLVMSRCRFQKESYCFFFSSFLLLHFVRKITHKT